MAIFTMDFTSKLFIFLLAITFGHALKRQDLGGKWKVANSNGEIAVDATVPGGIYTDLENGGIIEDVFYGYHDANYSWVGLEDWTYTGTFEVDDEIFNSATVKIIFEGLDTFATVLINGVEVGTGSNMFVRYAFNVKDQLQVGTNDIEVRFISPVLQSAALSDEQDQSYKVPPDCPPDAYRGVCHANQIRKMQASFSWDWGPAFPSVGIWKDVYLEAYNTAVIHYVTANAQRLGNGWEIFITIFFDGDGTVEGTVEATVLTPNGAVSITDTVSEETIHRTILDIPAGNVREWWPNGYGDQNLYNLTITLRTASETDQKTVRIGFRTVELVQETMDQGLSFYFKVNDVPVFAKGSNSIPMSVLPERGQDKATVLRVLQSARDAHMNMLRVWGGGVYESDYFYDLADEFGILIWQDFMFACAMYPSRPDFLQTVVAEVRHQVQRLDSHPSIAIWAGNNENEVALATDWYGTASNFELYKNDYKLLYVDTIMPEVSNFAPSVPYLTSSPTNGDESITEDFVAHNPQDFYYGDVHYYNYNSDSWISSTFPVPRFASEFGYQSMPSIDTWMTVTEDVADLHPDSAFVDHRQHHPNGNVENAALISNQLQLPDAASENYYKAFIFYSQVLQAQSYKVEVEHYRSFKGRVNEQGQGNTMGALYWQLNDVWVAPTWSGIDFTGKWKMAHYFARDFYAPVIIYADLNAEGEVVVYAICDLLEPPTGVMATMHVYRYDSLEHLSEQPFDVILDSSKSIEVGRVNAAEALASAGCGEYDVAVKDCFFHFHLMDQDGNAVAPMNYLFPEKLKNANVANANVKIEAVVAASEDGRQFDVTISTDAVAFFVWLDGHQIAGTFSMNGFLMVSATTVVRFVADEATTEADLTPVLTVTHLRDPVYL